MSANTTTEESDSTSLFAVSPSPTVSPWCSQNSDGPSGQPECPRATSTPVPSSPIVNPLVAAGLVLADILAPPSEDAAASKKRTKRITGARELTANEYTARLREEERKKKEVAEEKACKKEERKRKKEEKEEAVVDVKGKRKRKLGRRK